MSDFERDLVGTIPLHEAAEFFVEMKHHGWPDSSEETFAKVAAVKQSKAQQVISGLLEGKMPEGKAGLFKLAQYEPALLMQKRLKQQKAADRMGAKTLGSPSGAISQTIDRAAAQVTKDAAARFRAAVTKLAQDNPGAQQEQIPAMAEPSAAPQSAPQGQGAGGAPPAAPTQPPTVPQNYMGAELLAQQSQGMNESSFYRERLGKAVAENQALQQSAQQMQQSVEQLQQQAAASGEQIQAATQQATEAGDRALQSTQDAANMRMALQQLREQMLQVASQEPAAVTQQNQQQAESQMQQQAQQMMNPQAAQAGTPGASPAPGGGAPPGTPAAGSPEPGAGGAQARSSSPSKPAAETSSSKSGEKTAQGRLPYAIGGAGLGLAGAVAAMKGAPKMRKKLEKQKAEGGFSSAIDEAKAKYMLAAAERASETPIRSALSGAAGGALAASTLGPGIAGQAARAYRNVRPGV